MTTKLTGRIGEFLDEIGETPGTCAYRGQENERWLLHSSAIRRLSVFTKDPFFVNSRHFPDAFRSYHLEELIEPARSAGFALEQKREVSDLELLGKLQHFGAATGLLDFTWDPLVALWFACQKDGEEDCPGKVFALNLSDQQEFRRVSYESSLDELSFEKLFTFGRTMLPLYWEPMANSSAGARIIGQRSVFVIGLPVVPRHVVREFEVRAEDKKTLEKELAEKCGISGTALFRDVHGFSRMNNFRAPIRRMDKPEAYLIRGNWSCQRQEFPEAIESYSRALNLAGDTAEIFLLIANAYATTKDHSEALKHYQKAEECEHLFLDSASATSSRTRNFHRTLLFNRANSRAISQDFNGALSDSCKAVSFCPNAYWSVRVIFNRANIRVRMHQLSEALKDYQKVISEGGEGPDVPFADAQFNMGNVLVMLGRLEEARDCYEESSRSRRPNSQTAANITSLEKVLERVADSQIDGVTTLPDPSMNEAIQYVNISIGRKGKGQGTLSFPFNGNVGNIGNTGAMDPLNEVFLPGGEGHAGGTGFAVRVSFSS